MHARRLAKFAEATVGRLANPGRDALEPPLVIDHAVIDWDGVALLPVHIPEQAVKPAHRRGKSIEPAWGRSGGTTRKASRQETGAMPMNSRAPRWEELRASERFALPELAARIDVKAVCRLLQRPIPSDSDVTLRRLLDERVVEQDGDAGYLTHFGAIAAARDLRPFDALQRKRLRVIRHPEACDCRRVVRAAAGCVRSG